MIILQVWFSTHFYHYQKQALYWHHNERDGVSNHRRLDCLVSRLFRHGSNKTSKLVTGLCKGNPLVTDGFPSQRVSDAENVSIWWRHIIMCITILPNTSTNWLPIDQCLQYIISSRLCCAWFWCGCALNPKQVMSTINHYFSCTEFCSDHFVRTEVRTKRNFHRIRNAMERSLVKWAHVPYHNDAPQ